MTKTDACSLSSIRVLIAEDNPAVREFIERALSAAGAQIVSVSDGQEALTKLAQETFDVLVTDIVMPNIDGIALALKVTHDYPHTRIIMISGYAQERMRAHNLDALVHRIIAKPFSLEEICEAVQGVIEDNSLPTQE